MRDNQTPKVGPVTKDPAKKNPAVKENKAPGGKVFGSWYRPAKRIRDVKQ